jgi:hypothetical protein
MATANSHRDLKRLQAELVMRFSRIKIRSRPAEELKERISGFHCGVGAHENIERICSEIGLSPHGPIFTGDYGKLNYSR